MAKILVVQGPTAVGKSGVAVKLAAHYNCPVISADSRQFYREMMIGTAVPTPEEMDGVKHYLIQDRSVCEPLSAGEFELEAVRLIEELSVGREDSDIVAVVAGGSGLYVDALLYGLDKIPSDPAVRGELNDELEQEGIESLAARLKVLDPVYFDKVELSNPQRVLRALEATIVSGRPYSELRIGERANRPFTAIKIIIDLPREELYSRINQRVDEMVSQGLVEEAQSVYKYRDLSALRTVGYSELFEHFDGAISLERAIELIKQHTRNYAKRQITWLRRDTTTPRLSPFELEKIIEYITSEIE